MSISQKAILLKRPMHNFVQNILQLKFLATGLHGLNGITFTLYLYLAMWLLQIHTCDEIT